ncbi:hypothetical protein [Pelomonas cellulosilytica]|uniref:Uncharacterized protein n=1 Tax=Pelomonas cellulosilytica TaxID=2906762 RepID=A0ABS8XYV6_9BURK|nr:hypothetical protein [Pelomonas sp. P8]MCE4555801.1 hypothetical protein [Pelomonas sp. P8]
MKRIHIERLDLDLRGIDPALAEAAVRLLGPALEARLGGVTAPLPEGRTPQVLANHLADRIAGRLPSTETFPHAARRPD